VGKKEYLLEKFLTGFQGKGKEYCDGKRRRSIEK